MSVGVFGVAMDCAEAVATAQKNKSAAASDLLLFLLFFAGFLTVLLIGSLLSRISRFGWIYEL
jgi:hypothetical protein